MNEKLGIYKSNNHIIRLAIIADFGDTFVYQTREGKWFTMPDNFFDQFKKVSDATTWEEFGNQISQGHKQSKQSEEKNDV